MEARQHPVPHSEREEHDGERQRKEKNVDVEETAPTVFFPTKFCGSHGFIFRKRGILIPITVESKIASQENYGGGCFY